ncbi:MAG: cytochrome c peroxidase [Saprospiraceae bacterium]|nr:cytochrome c peroxidase [Saprospiraceae bacterium]
MRNLTLLTLLVGLGFLSACHSDAVQPAPDQQLRLPLESHDYTIPDIPPEVFPMGSLVDQVSIDNHAAALGRVLFYDRKLSLNNSVSCASCHLQEKAFADPRAASVGFEGRLTSRNSIAISNPALVGHLFWDSRSPNLIDLALRPVENHVEMGFEDFDALAAKLAQTDYYPELFEQAYPGAGISKQGIASALTEFMMSMISFDSKYDRGIMNDFTDFTAEEHIGMNLFFSQRLACTNCHAAPTFTQASDFNGVGSNPYQSSKGAANIGLDRHYLDPGFRDGLFKIPSLRNVGLTAPYMHDGRFATLEEVIDHYSDGIQPHPHLDHNLRNVDGSPRLLHLNTAEKKALVAFLHTLTDESYITDSKYSDPFR